VAVAFLLAVLLLPVNLPAAAGAGGPGSTAQSTLGGKPGKPKPAMSVTAHSVRHGDEVTLSGTGFAPHAHIVVSFHSSPVVVGSTTADDAGGFSVTVTVPATATSGEHHFEAQGPGPDGEAQTMSAPVRVAGPSGHSSWVVPVVMILLTVLIIAGASFAWARLSSHRPLAPER
jgi:hypothetical protein